MRFGGDSGLMGRAADGERGSAEACAARAALVGWWPAMALRPSPPRRACATATGSGWSCGQHPPSHDPPSRDPSPHDPPRRKRDSSPLVSVCEAPAPLQNVHPASRTLARVSGPVCPWRPCVLFSCVYAVSGALKIRSSVHQKTESCTRILHFSCKLLLSPKVPVERCA